MQRICRHRGAGATSGACTAPTNDLARRIRPVNHRSFEPAGRPSSSRCCRTPASPPWPTCARCRSRAASRGSPARRWPSACARSAIAYTRARRCAGRTAARSDALLRRHRRLRGDGGDRGVSRRPRPRRRRDAQRQRLCLMCAEREPLDCHRCLLVARALAERGRGGRPHPRRRHDRAARGDRGAPARPDGRAGRPVRRPRPAWPRPIAAAPARSPPGVRPASGRPAGIKPSPRLKPAPSFRLRPCGERGHVRCQRPVRPPSRASRVETRKLLLSDLDRHGRNLPARRRRGTDLSTDDAMRLVEVRDLLAGQGWFDLTQYRLSPPGGVAMHWSRLVDVPLAVADPRRRNRAADRARRAGGDGGLAGGAAAGVSGRASRGSRANSPTRRRRGSR